MPPTSSTPPDPSIAEAPARNRRQSIWLRFSAAWLGALISSIGVPFLTRPADTLASYLTFYDATPFAVWLSVTFLVAITISFGWLVIIGFPKKPAFYVFILGLTMPVVVLSLIRFVGG